MPLAVPRPLLAALALALVGLTGCGKGAAQPQGGGPARQLAPVASQGAVSLATRNTTRLGGASVAADAAAVARTVYPGLTAASRPAAAVLVDEHEWAGALAASVLAGAPIGAPILFSEGASLPAVSAETLAAMHPLGTTLLGGAQVIRLGADTPLPAHYVTHTVPAGTPAATAAAIERLALALDGGHAPRQAIVLDESIGRSRAMPAAGLAAESGAPILFVGGERIPAPTAAALAALHRPTIYVLDAAAVAPRALARLRRLGRVVELPSGPASTTLAEPGAPQTDISTEATVRSAIEVARYTSGDFGWGVKEPGHGLVFANAARPLDAPAAALLSASGDYGPLLLLASNTLIPQPLVRYLADIQPAYSDPQFPPVRGSYNHGWLIGDETAISAVSQAELDSMLEIVPRTQTQEEETSASPE